MFSEFKQTAAKAAKTIKSLDGKERAGEDGIKNIFSFLNATWQFEVNNENGHVLAWNEHKASNFFASAVNPVLLFMTKLCSGAEVRWMEKKFRVN